MFHIPISSPMMTTMFGRFAATDGRAVVAAGIASARASSRLLSDPSEQQGGGAGGRPGAPVAAGSSRVAEVVTSALDEGLRSLLAATKPSSVPSPTQARA